MATFVFYDLTIPEYGSRIWPVKIIQHHTPTPVALAAVRFGAVVLFLLLMHCSSVLPLFVGARVYFLIYCVVFGVLSLIVSVWEVEGGGLLLCFSCLLYVAWLNVLWLFLMVPRVSLQCAIVAFPCHTCLPFQVRLNISPVRSEYWLCSKTRADKALVLLCGSESLLGAKVILLVYNIQTKYGFDWVEGN